MKTILLFFIILLYAPSSFSQNGATTFLTWMKGDNTIGQVGIYGTKGIEAAANKPGGRDFSATWTDNNGNLWLFGGYGFDGNSLGYLNDLWKYNSSTNQWTWVKGENIVEQSGVYGVQGVAHAANTPGALYSSVSWTDGSGNFWLYGGFGYSSNDFGFVNDLWKFDPSTNKWTWVKGDNTVDQIAVYGIQGIANSANKPGGRYGSLTWTDISGNLWLLGGYGPDSSSTTGILNDLWKYSPANNKWTWIKGDNKADQPGVFGQKGIANASNKPGGRYVSVSWTDGSGNFWLFGGYGYDAQTSGLLNDLWKYDPVANKWTWINGDSTVNHSGIYGVQGIADGSNKPGARNVSVSWTDATGNLWLFGGYGYDTSVKGYLNDLWKYNTITNTWTWVKGDARVNQLGVYGTQGSPALSNKSGSRTSCVSWTDTGGNLWLFGGYGFGSSSSGILNDLWKISSIAPLPVKLISFTGVLNNDIAALQWQTSQELYFSHFNVQRSFDGINFTVIGNLTATGNNTSNDYGFIDNDLRNRQAIKVFYRLQLVDKDGSITYSKIIRFDLGQKTVAIHIFPNPAVQSLNLSFDQNKAGLVEISIIDLKGITLIKQISSISAGRASINIDVSSLPSSAYIISLVNSSGTIQQKFIKQ